MSTSVPTSLTFSVSGADAARIEAVAQALGFPSIQAYAVSLITNAVTAHEMAAAQQQLTQNYVPIAVQ